MLPRSHYFNQFNLLNSPVQSLSLLLLDVALSRWMQSFSSAPHNRSTKKTLNIFRPCCAILEIIQILKHVSQRIHCNEHNWLWLWLFRNQFIIAMYNAMPVIFHTSSKYINNCHHIYQSQIILAPFLSTLKERRTQQIAIQTNLRWTEWTKTWYHSLLTSHAEEN